MMRFLIIFALCFLQACSISADIDSAKSSVEIFRKDLAEKNFEKIHDSLSDEFKKQTPKDKFKVFLDETSTTLGDLKKTEQINFNVQKSLNGTFVALVYKSEYSKKENVTEQFIYKKTDNGYLLFGYRYTVNA